MFMATVELYIRLYLSIHIIDRLSKNREEEEENEQHKGYILCLGYLATID